MTNEMPRTYFFSHGQNQMLVKVRHIEAKIRISPTLEKNISR